MARVFTPRKLLAGLQMSGYKSELQSHHDSAHSTGPSLTWQLPGHLLYILLGQDPSSKDPSQHN